MNRREFLRRSQGLLLGTSLLAAPAAAGRAAEPAGGAGGQQPQPAAGPLRVHPDNRRYFADSSGRAVYLTGSHTWNNLVDMGPDDPPKAFDFPAYLKWMRSLNHNFIRLWTWESVTWDTSRNGRNAVMHAMPHPWARTGPGNARDGKPRFDLAKFDTDYFRRLRERVEAAGRQGIYVSVMLFEGWGMQFAPGAWENHPFHPDNNRNGIDGDLNGDGKGLEVHTLAQPAVTRLQEAYVRKVIDTVGDLDNVLYEISNENHPPSTEWQYHMIRFIHDHERQKAKRHPVGMTFQYKGGSNQTLFDSPADWISPNPEGGYRDDPPAADGRKVILSDADHLWGIGGSAAWAWKSFLRGLNPLFMDPYRATVLGPTDGRWEAIRRALGFTRRLALQVDLATMLPRDELATSGYCLARTGNGRPEYLVYLPDGGRVGLDLGTAAGALRVAWFHPGKGTLQAAGTAKGGGKAEFEAPFDGDAVLWLKA